MLAKTDSPAQTATLEVKVGQVWQDNDPRRTRSGPPRLLKIVWVHEDGYAEVVAYPEIAGDRHRRIRLDRFRPTHNGYVLYNV